MEYSVKLEHLYEGPIACLYELVKASKIDICDIPIGRITEQYLEYLRFLQSVDIEVGSEFILMAATLMHIKSEMLLPREVKPEGRDREDPRKELIEKLLEYQKFKEAVTALEEKSRARADLLFREKRQGLLEFDDEANWADISIYDLLNAFSEIVSFVEDPVFVQTEPESVTEAMKINTITERIDRDGKILFGELFSDRITRLEVIVTFLALLSLVKAGVVRIQQHLLFGDIRILKAGHPESKE
jgi:segregation and condensation protein A